MAALDLVTLAEFKAAFANPLAGPAKDTLAARVITDASRRIESACGRRLRYRGPVEEGADPILDEYSWPADTGATPAVAAQPDSEGRTLIVTWSTATAGVLTAVGTVAGATKTVAFDAADGLVQHGVDFFTHIASLDISPAAAGGGTVSITTSRGYEEFHSFPFPWDIPATAQLRTLERPLQQVLKVNEDLYRAYAAATLLVVDTDYVISKGSGRLMRITDAQQFPWLTGWRAVRVLYSAGYFGPANVPADIKGEVLRVAMLLFNEAAQGRIGVSSGSDVAGNWTRFGPGGVPKETLDALWAGGHVRAESTLTGERDWDTEAA